MRNFLIAGAAAIALTACKNSETVKTNDTDSTTVVTTDTTSMQTSTDSTAMANDMNNGMTSSADAETAKKFVEGGMMEVMLGQLAQTNASNAKVKEFGKQMIADHTKAGDELKALASQKGWTVPTELGAEKKAKYDELAAKKGADFDKAYSQFMVDDHEKDVAEYKETAASAADADFKNFAQKTVPTLEHHLMMAKDAAAAVK